MQQRLAHRPLSSAGARAGAAAASAPRRVQRRARVGAASTEAAPADLEQRRTFTGVPLPPVGAKTTRLVTIKPGLLWALQQDFPDAGAASIHLNCSVAMLSGGGGLLVYSPVAPTQEALDMVASMGAPVKHIVAPSLSPEHWLYVKSFAAAHPDATVWVCPGERERERERARERSAFTRGGGGGGSGL